MHGIVQADAVPGFGRLYDPGRKPGQIREAACWAHARHEFFEQADLRQAPIAVEAVTRIDAIFAIERAANGLARDEHSIPPIAVGRRNGTFAGSDAGGDRVAAHYTRIDTATLNRIHLQAWLADVLARLPDHPARRIDDPLPGNWTPSRLRQIAA